MVDIDLKAAGIPKNTKEGKIDFHSWRVAFVSFVLESGASMKEAQTLARHATPDLTMNICARTRETRLAEVAERVGGRLLGRPNITGAHRGNPKKLTHCGTESYLVEAAGIEPASGSASTQASTCIARLLRFAPPEPFGLGSRLR